MRALVTGATGFVGRHVVDALRARGHETIAAGGPDDTSGALPIDLADEQSLHAAFDVSQPDAVFHLAAQAFVPLSIEDPLETYRANVLGTANVLHALRDAQRRFARSIRLLFISSAEVYGAQPPEAMPLAETRAPNPVNPYAASKAAAEALVLGEARAFGVQAIITRAFNHIGPGQNERFVVPSLAAQLAAIASGGEPVLLVGNLQAKRDFLDVRDVALAYVLLAEHGTPGETYNVCSGTAVSIRDVLGELIRIAHVAVEVREDPARMRPVDVPVLFGDNAKLRAAVEWKPQYTLHRSLQDVYRQLQMSRT